MNPPWDKLRNPVVAIGFGQFTLTDASTADKLGRR